MNIIEHKCTPLIMSQIKDKSIIFAKELNDIFRGYDTGIKLMLNQNNMKTHTKKLSFNDALLYKLLCVYKNNTNSKVCADLNFKNIIVNKNNYYKKEQKNTTRIL